MSLANQIKNQHLMWRAGFGPAVEQLADLPDISSKQLYKALQKASSKTPEYIDVADDFLKGLWAGIDEVGRQEKIKDMKEEDRKKIQQKQRESVRSLNLNWLKVFVNTDAQLREKMAFFWHGHFACRNLNVFYQQGLLDIIRRNALGSFRDMLHEVSKSAAMLLFLNNQQNRKDHPNENYAREVMELFTLGRGNYTEKDIQEAARAFTGTFVQNDRYKAVPAQHDDGEKTVLGKSGKFTGDDISTILLAQPACAEFLAKKLFRHFLSDVD